MVTVGLWYGQGIGYGQWTQLHFINGNLNAQRYRDELLSPNVVPFIHPHHLTFQHNTQPHVVRICTQFLEAENVPFLPWPTYSPDMLSIGHVWDALDWCVRQSVPVPANIQKLCTAIEEEWDNIPQATINNLRNYAKEMLCCMMQMVVTPDTDWFSDPLFLRYLWPTDAYLYSQSCEIHRLLLNEFISIDWFPYEL